ncbi:MAG: DNA mismatch repair protein MutS [Candidatus Theseobacter exili]|nr:DNA mismatch repair protein MutS [Candidatus Theseobacter exili]
MTLTPMMKQYKEIKNKYPDTILFYRLGDFYEMFFEDAKEASGILNITLTARDGGKGNKVPMCGIPYHAAESYLAKILTAGKKVAICEQVGDPKQSKGLVHREVKRVITPGTVLSEHVLADRRNNYLASFFFSGKNFGFAYVDVSAGVFKLTEMKDSSDLIREILSVSPSELLIPDELPGETEQVVDEIQRTLYGIMITKLDSWHFESEFCRKTIYEHFKVQSLDGFGLQDMDPAVTAAGALLVYLQENIGEKAGHIRPPAAYFTNEHMVIGSATRRNLELTESLRGSGHEGTLLSVMDETVTSMGARLLSEWILHPLLDVERIFNRQESVDAFFENPSLLQQLRDVLKDIRDMERILGRLTCGYGNARDLVAIKNSLKSVPFLVSILDEIDSEVIHAWKQQLDSREKLIEVIENAIEENPPLLVRDGGIVREGFDPALDELRSISSGGKNWIAALQKQEVQRTGIKSLKVGYNKVFGYYLEVSNSNLDLVPEDYIRKQTLVNAERYITAELKEQESKVLGAQERSRELEYKIFSQIKEKVISDAQSLQSIASSIARLDVITNLAYIALRFGYIRPELSEEDEIEIKGGRHPVIERMLEGEKFIPNDTLLDTHENQLLILTGPNMAGKSTFIRQVALLVLMSQMGSFIPADKARVGIADRIFTRVGASDELSRGHSTFMVEMNETANILNNATQKSLIILDEIGRGTSTFDGISIAWAVAEYIHNNQSVRARTLFATHYHELTDLEMTLTGVKNYNVAVREWNDKIVFLRKIVRGGTDKSYGIHVARLAGIPVEVIERAKDILNCLEEGTIAEYDISSQGAFRQSKVEKIEPKQLPLFGGVQDETVLDEIRKIDLNKMTPLEAMNKIEEFQNRIQ